MKIEFCNVVMSSEDTKALEFNQYQKSDKAPFINYVNLECLIENIDGWKNNPENSSTTKEVEHFHQVFFQYLQYHYLKAWKVSMIYTEVKTASKSFMNPEDNMQWM